VFSFRLTPFFLFLAVLWQIVRLTARRLSRAARHDAQRHA
jgi:hypothetical protein